MIKRIVKVTFSFLIIFACFFLVKVYTHAADDTSDKIFITGAQIRTDAKSGIRFIGDFSEYTAPAGRSISKYGICLAYGKADISDVKKGNTVNGKSVAFAEDSELDDLGSKIYRVTIWNIPSEHYEDYMTARAYVVLDNDDVVYATTTKERNLVDVARCAKADGETGALITTLTTNKDVRVTNGSTVKYYSTLAEVTIADGDNINLIGSKTFSDALTISNDNVTISGRYEGLSGISVEREDANETVLSLTITVNNGADNFTLDGVKLTATNGIKFKGSHNGAHVINSIFTPAAEADSVAISDAKAGSEDYADNTQSNFVIKDNYFLKAAVGTRTISKEVYFQSVVYKMSITDNFFYNNYNHDDLLAAPTNYDYAIKLNRISSELDNTLLIKDNVFTKLGSHYLMDLGYSNTDSLRVAGVITIENNELSSGTSQNLGANGIRIFHLGSNATVNIIHNKRFVISRYYNAIFLSVTSDIKPTDDAMPTINIKFNLFYTLKDESDYVYTTLGGRNEVTTRYTRIGICVSETNKDSTKVTYDSNYFNSGTSTSRGVYSSNTTGSAVVPFHTTLPSTNKVSKVSEANDAYTEYLK